jgi:hypothetical protein
LPLLASGQTYSPLSQRGSLLLRGGITK